MKRLLILFAVLGVVGTAAAFGPGALPGPAGPASPVLPDGTGGGTMTGALTVNKTASTAETLASFGVSDATGAIGFVNNQAADGTFAGTVEAFTTAPSPFGITAVISAGADTGGNPVMSFGTATGTALGALTGGIATRDILGITNYSTTLATLSATGAWSNPSSNTCGALNAGDWCFGDGVTLATGGTALVTMKAGTTSAYAGSNFTDSGGSVVGQFLYAGSLVSDADIADKVYLSAQNKMLALHRADNVAAASVLIEVRDNTTATGVPHLYVKGDGLVALGVTPQALTCADSGGAGAGAMNVDPQSSTVIITNNDTLGGCVATMQETSVSGTTNALGARVTICSSPQSQATLLSFPDVANVYRGGATQATGLLPGDCFDMVYIDATDDLWLATSPVSIN